MYSAPKIPAPFCGKAPPPDAPPAVPENAPAAQNSAATPLLALLLLSLCSPAEPADGDAAK